MCLPNEAFFIYTENICTMHGAISSRMDFTFFSEVALTLKSPHFDSLGFNDPNLRAVALSSLCGKPNEVKL